MVRALPGYSMSVELSELTLHSSIIARDELQHDPEAIVLVCGHERHGRQVNGALFSQLPSWKQCPEIVQPCISTSLVQNRINLFHLLSAHVPVSVRLEVRLIVGS